MRTQQPTEFTALRNRARDRRDRVIAHARTEYESALVQIATLEQDLMGRDSSRHKKISSCIESVIPRDRPFSTLDVLASLEALDPGRVWRKRSIDNHISRLRERGLIHRLRRATTHEPALYARDGVKASVAPTGDMKLKDVIRAVLLRPMTTTEVAVSVMEAGYHSTMAKTALRNHITRELRHGGFKRDGAKWVAE